MLYIEGKISMVVVYERDILMEKSKIIMDENSNFEQIGSVSHLWKVFAEQGIAKIEELLFSQDIRQMGKIARSCQYKLRMANRLNRLGRKKQKFEKEENDFFCFEIFGNNKDFKSSKVQNYMFVMSKDTPMDDLFKLKSKIRASKNSKTDFFEKSIIAIASLDGFSFFKIHF